MKIRNGFVSNSSSSSFVLLGWKTEEYDKTENAREKVKEITDGDAVDFGGFDDEVCGISLGRWYENDTTFSPTSLESLQDAINKAKAIAEALNLPEPQLFKGSQLS